MKKVFYLGLVVMSFLCFSCSRVQENEVVEGKRSLKLNTAGSFNFRGCTIRSRERTSTMNRFSEENQDKLKRDILAFQFKRYLIINADDLGFDQATNDAIIKCYTEGIVTSTTAYVNFPDSVELIKSAHEKYPDFPIGIHLNITLGKPVLPPEEIPTMVNKKTGEFWNEDQILSHIADMSYEDVKKEVHAQIERFIETGVPLDHIDYHNHLLALYTPYHQIVREEALRLNIPVRNPVPYSTYKKIKVPSGGGDSAAISKMIIYGMLHPFKAIPMMKKVGPAAFIEQDKITRESGIKTPDWFVDVFYENSTPEIFLSILDQLPEGLSEIMCHPGSSESEIKILTDPEIKEKLLEKEIELTDFSRM